MKLKPVVVVLGLAISAMASAQESNFTLTGFGTAAVTRTNTSDAEFARQAQLNGARDSFNTGVDSNLGLQVSYKANDWLSFTGQGLVSKHITDEFGAELTWAFAKMKASENLSVRVGRMGIPVYMISDYQNVGYSSTFIRPPVEMYSQVPLTYVEGADAIYQMDLGDGSLSAQFAYGRTETKGTGNSYTAKFKDLMGLNLVYDNGPFTVRFGHIRTKFSVDDSASLNAVVGGLTKFGFTDAANSLIIKDTKASFTSLGLGVNWKGWTGQAEYGVRRSDARSLPDTTSWYTLVGYKWGNFTPYYLHSDIKQDGGRTIAGLPTTGPLAALVAGANAYASNAPVQSSNSVGLRWDFHKAAALKVQYDRISPKDGAGTFVNPKPGFAGPVNVLAVGIDFVF
jgi:hypothetical protein